MLSPETGSIFSSVWRLIFGMHALANVVITVERVANIVPLY